MKFINTKRFQWFWQTWFSDICWAQCLVAELSSYFHFHEQFSNFDICDTKTNFDDNKIFKEINLKYSIELFMSFATIFWNVILGLYYDILGWKFWSLNFKVEIFLEQGEVAFLSPSKICENLNFSTEIQIFANFAGW